MKILRIATRKSQLARWQATHVKERLLKHHPELHVELISLTTQGDKFLGPLTTIGGKGVFVKELETAILDGQADIAVHSMKDVPVELPENLHIPVICKREDPRDVLIVRQHKKPISTSGFKLDLLSTGAIVGTSSLRRQCQLKALYPTIEIKPLRGNVDTRLAKLDRGQYSAIILAAAGLIRLGWEKRITHYFSIDTMLPAPGQGAIGIECRKDNTEVHQLIAPLHDEITGACVLAERAMNAYLGGDCHVPIAAYAQVKHGELLLQGLVGNLEGTLLVRSTDSGKLETANVLGQRVAEKLLSQGAKKILHKFRT